MLSISSDFSDPSSFPLLLLFLLCTQTCPCTAIPSLPSSSLSISTLPLQENREDRAAYTLPHRDRETDNRRFRVTPRHTSYPASFCHFLYGSYLWLNKRRHFKFWSQQASLTIAPRPEGFQLHGQTLGTATNVPSVHLLLPSLSPD